MLQFKQLQRTNQVLASQSADFQKEIARRNIAQLDLEIAALQGRSSNGPTGPTGA